MQRFLVAGLFFLCAAGTGFAGAQEIGLGELGRWHVALGASMLAVAALSMVFISLIEDALLCARRSSGSNRNSR